MSDAGEPAGEAPDASEALLAYDLSAARLRARARWAGVVLVAALALPFEIVGRTPIFLWDLLGELHPAAAVAALIPVVAGLTIGGFSRFVRRPSALAAVILLVRGCMSGVIEIGSDAAAWDILPLPDSLTRRPESAVVSLGLAGAATELSSRAETRRAGLWLTALAAAAALVFALWPTRGEVPLATFTRVALALPGLPSWRLVLGYGVILFLSLLPILAVAAAAVFAMVPRRRAAPLASLLVTFALPGALLFMVFRNLLLTFGDSSVPASVAAALVLAALIALIGAAGEVGALWLAGLGAGSELEQGRPPARVLVPAAGAAAALLVVQAVLARPPEKGVSWALGPARAEQLFGELLPRWAISQALWEQRSRHTSSAEELSEARAAGRELLGRARAIDAGLASALAALVSESKQLDLAGRRWFRLVEQVNEASRAAKLPYYVDPTVVRRELGGDGRRLFLMFPYRIETVRQVDVEGNPFALLHVRRLGEARANHARLGFSRDVQPFALVVLDEIEPYAASLAELGAADPPGCVKDPSGAPALRSCGELLKKLRPTAGDLLKLTERHELQHQIDGPHLPLSDLVLQALGGYEEAAQIEVNRELSAYVAELTTPAVSPKLGLVHLLPFAHGRRQGALHHVAVLAFEALTRSTLRDARGNASLESVGSAFIELSALPDGELRRRAGEAWQRLFDDELAEVSAL